MSEQDTDTDEADLSSDETEESVDGEAAVESLSEIAQEPDDDIESALAAARADEDSSRDEHPEVDPEEIDEEFVDEIAETDPETITRAIYLLREEIQRLDRELTEERERADDLESRLKRKQADFQNYKKRQKERKQEEIQRATEDLVERLLDVRDNLKRALEQDEDADIRSGVESTLEQFDQELDRENVTAIEPEPGDEVDPQRHEVLATIDADQPEDTIADVHRPGYEMSGKILRAAQVAVSESSGEQETTE